MPPKTEPPHLKERHHFKALLAENPNYFGHLADSPHAPVLDLVAARDYESIVALGHHATDDRLEAIVRLHQGVGYGSDVAGPGSTLYVRFYLSTDAGAHWRDHGVGSFVAFNVNTDDADDGLSFSASVRLPAPLAELAGPARSVRVRAILAWQQCPPPDAPHWRPVWGEVAERVLFERPAPAEHARPTDALAPSAPGADASAPPVHRRAQVLRAALCGDDEALTAEAFTKLLNGMPDTDAPALSHRPMTLCALALDPNTPEALVAVVRIDAAEAALTVPGQALRYVNFWLVHTPEHPRGRYLGSACLSAAAADSSGHLVARLPVDFGQLRRPGHAGPVLAEVIASTSSARPLSDRLPEPADRHHARILIAPGPPAMRGKLAIIGGIRVSDIDRDGTTQPCARFAASGLPADDLGRPCPFGGLIRIHGPALGTGHSYSIELRPQDGGPARTLKAPIRLRRKDGSVWLHHPDPESGRYAYVPFEFNVEELLGEWASEGDGAYTVTLWTYQMDGRPVGMDGCRLQLANSAPDCDLLVDADPADTGQAPTQLQCTYRARDPWFGSARLELCLPQGREAVAASHTQTPPRGLQRAIPLGNDTPERWLHMTVRNRSIIDSHTAGRECVETIGLVSGRA